MKVLLDTHAFIWWDSEPHRLTTKAFSALQAQGNLVLLSVVSVWEIQIKVQTGKLILNMPVDQIVAKQQANGIGVLPIHLDHVLSLELLPAVHRDPFDRLLAAQAIHEGAQLITADPVFAQYPVSVLW